jgi:hypothetical protein
VDQNKDRLLRAIRGLQLIQRTNHPKSSIARVVAKALEPLLKEYAEMTPGAAPIIPPGSDTPA